MDKENNANVRQTRFSKRIERFNDTKSVPSQNEMIDSMNTTEEKTVRRGPRSPLKTAMESSTKKLVDIITSNPPTATPVTHKEEEAHFGHTTNIHSGRVSRIPTSIYRPNKTKVSKVTPLATPAPKQGLSPQWKDVMSVIKKHKHNETSPKKASPKPTASPSPMKVNGETDDIECPPDSCWVPVLSPRASKEDSSSWKTVLSPVSQHPVNGPMPDRKKNVTIGESPIFRPPISPVYRSEAQRQKDRAASGESAQPTDIPAPTPPKPENSKGRFSIEPELIVSGSAIRGVMNGRASPLSRKSPQKTPTNDVDVVANLSKRSEIENIQWCESQLQGELDKDGSITEELDIIVVNYARNLGFSVMAILLALSVIFSTPPLVPVDSSVPTLSFCLLTDNATTLMPSRDKLFCPSNLPVLNPSTMDPPVSWLSDRETFDLISSIEPLSIKFDGASLRIDENMDVFEQLTNESSFEFDAESVVSMEKDTTSADDDVSSSESVINQESAVTYNVSIQSEQVGDSIIESASQVIVSTSNVSIQSEQVGDSIIESASQVIVSTSNVSIQSGQRGDSIIESTVRSNSDETPVEEDKALFVPDGDNRVAVSWYQIYCEGDEARIMTLIVVTSLLAYLLTKREITAPQQAASEVTTDINGEENSNVELFSSLEEQHSLNLSSISPLKEIEHHVGAEPTRLSDSFASYLSSPHLVENNAAMGTYMHNTDLDMTAERIDYEDIIQPDISFDQTMGIAELTNPSHVQSDEKDNRSARSGVEYTPLPSRPPLAIIMPDPLDTSTNHNVINDYEHDVSIMFQSARKVYLQNDRNHMSTSKSVVFDGTASDSTVSSRLFRHKKATASSNTRKQATNERPSGLRRSQRVASASRR